MTAQLPVTQARPRQDLVMDLVIPNVGPITGIEEVELCSDPQAGFDRHYEDSERLLTAFEKILHGHEALLTKAVALTEERVLKGAAIERKAAVEAAISVAEKAADKRVAMELRNAVTEAVVEARAAAKVAQDSAITEAVKLAEERAIEQQRLAVQNVTSTYQRAVGRPEEEILATKAANSFQQAAASAAAALAASTRLELLSRDTAGDETELLSTELSSTDQGDGRHYSGVAANLAQPVVDDDKNASLHFF